MGIIDQLMIKLQCIAIFFPSRNNDFTFINYVPLVYVRAFFPPLSYTKLIADNIVRNHPISFDIIAYIPVYWDKGLYTEIKAFKSLLFVNIKNTKCSTKWALQWYYFQLQEVYSNSYSSEFTLSVPVIAEWNWSTRVNLSPLNLSRV